MRLKLKVFLFAVIPLIASLLLIAVAVRQKENDLAARERAVVEAATMASKQTELRHYVDLAQSTIAPLYASGRDDDATKEQAIRRLASLDYGSDGYFFLYDLAGKNLMHPRQPELVGQPMWDMRDANGEPVIQRLIARAREGGGFVEYLWRKPSTGQVTPKLGYVVALPRWNWMFGTGLYLDDVQATMKQLDQQVTANIADTMWWIAGIALLGIVLIGGSGLALNVSEQRIADAKLRLLARQVVQSQEDERGHLARELHDGTSQTLVSAKLLIESAVDALERTHQVAPPALGKALQRLNDSLSEVRRISHRLRPALLDTLGLPAALERLGEEFGEEGAVTASVMVHGTPRELPEEVKTALFRVTQEALTNVRKHARAQQVRIALDFDADGVRLEVGDDGTGFDVDAMQLDPRRGIGLRNMRERVAAIGGRLRVRSGSSGTSILADVPADGAEPA